MVKTIGGVHSLGAGRLRGAAAFLVLAGASVLGAAWAQSPAVAGSRIAQVTLYPGSATVQCVAKVAAGARKLVFACLPASLEVPSLVVTAEPGVRVGELSVLSEERDAAPACASTALDGRIRELQDKQAALQGEHEALDIVTGYLKGVASSESAPGVIRSATDPKNVAGMADTLRRQVQDALARQHQLKRQQEELDRVLKPLLAQQTRALAGRARLVTVSVTLDAPREADVSLSYQVNGPGWAPAYRALLDTSARTVRLERQALVAQATGEDWSGVQMRLSTGQPRRGTTGPQPRPWRIGIAAVPEQSAMKTYAAAPMAAPAPAPASRQRGSLASGTEEQAPSFDVSVFNNAFATEFNVPQRIDVPSSGQRVTLALGSIESKVDLLARTTPLADASAWLIAELPQPEGVWPSGALQLYRDGAYVGADTLRTGGTRPLNLSFGRDEQVMVQVEPQKDMQGSAGFVGSRIERSMTHAYTVENRHSTPVALQVLEASPVAIDEQVKIEAQFEPKPASLAWNEQPGTILWSTRLEAGKKIRFTAGYAITYPKDARLQESR